MVTRITPVFVSDGTGRDTYILLDQDFKKGFREPPAEFMFDLRSGGQRGSHAKGYQRWFNPSKRSTAFAPKVPGPVVQLPSKAASRSVSVPKKLPQASKPPDVSAWTARPGGKNKSKAWQRFEKLFGATSA
eukprot:CAMPEP_0181470036 /NCGR_PEP_ID=MMETSP1110-20121109/38342_1 /TAXON_ID=174948 /ORGANISM="Symbiodinium sp., Strain CCMP421" /LENGTH=130 /DNA_ID=CAMNT_0023594991 /DNA_START=70 /DNA_END=462 /DNA_ORIENTATION=+